MPKSSKRESPLNWLKTKLMYADWSRALIHSSILLLILLSTVLIIWALQREPTECAITLDVQSLTVTLGGKNDVTIFQSVECSKLLLDGKAQLDFTTSSIWP